MSLVFTQSDLDNLKAALISGALRVQIGDRLVIYRSQKEISDLIQVVKAYLDAATVSSTSSPNTVQAGFSRKKNC